MDELFLNSLTEGDFGTGFMAMQSLVEGDFWGRWSDEWYLIYRSETDEDFDYSLPVHHYQDGDTTAVVSNQALAPASGEARWQYVQRAVGKDGTMSIDSPVVTVVVDSNGDMTEPVGHAPTALQAEAIKGAIVRLTWQYVLRATQDATPTGFKVYRRSGGSWALQDTITYNKGRRNWSWDSGALSDGTRYEYIVRTYRTVSAVDHEEDNETVVSAVADSTGPAAITGVSLTQL